MKNFTSDFSAVGDNATDNTTPFTNAINYINNTGDFVYCAPGSYLCSSTTLPAISNTGGFCGSGAGIKSGAWVPTFPGGTVFRHNATSGNFLTINGGFKTSIRDIGFCPVQLKTSGAEIYITGGNATEYTDLRDLCFAFTYISIQVGACVDTRINNIQALFCLNSHINLKGTGSGVGIVNGCYLEDIITGIGNEVGGPFKTSWTANTSISVGEQMLANGYIWSCVTPGTTASSGSGPVFTPSNYSTSYGPWFQNVSDGSAAWVLMCASSSWGIVIDSYSYDVRIHDANLNAGAYGLGVIDSVGATNFASAPNLIQTNDLYVDHTFWDGISLTGGYNIQMLNTQSECSLTGNGLNVSASFGGDLMMNGGMMSNNSLAGIYTYAGPKNMSFNGMEVVNNSRTNSNTYSGFEMANTTDFSITNCNISNNGINLTPTQKYAIDMGGTCNNFVITGNRTLGNATGAINNPAGTGATKVVANNI